jgi:hypothetical protein
MRAVPRIIGCLFALALACGADLAGQPSQAPQRILIVADDLTVQFCSTPRVRDLMRHAVQALRRDGDQIAMVSTGLSGVAVPLSSDWNKLDIAISGVIGEALSPRAILGAPLTADVEANLRRRATTSYSIVTKAIRSMPALPGQNPLIVLYFSDGYPGWLPKPLELIRQTQVSGSGFEATIYAIDPRGFEEAGPDCIAERTAYIAATRGSLRTLAEGTNGSAVFTAGELDAVLLTLAKPASFVP